MTTKSVPPTSNLSVSSLLDSDRLRGIPQDCPVLQSDCDLINQLPDPILLIEPATWRVLAANPALEFLTGYTREELLQLQLPQLILGPARELGELRERLLRERHLNNSPGMLRAKNGDLIAIERSVSLLRLDHRQAACCVVRDIRERQHLEEEYRQAQKMEVIGRLSSGVAHDFNNLLTVILGQVELLAGHPACPPILHPRVTMIRDAAQRASQLTQKMLAYSRRQETNPRAQDLRPLAANAAGLAQPLLGSAIQLRLEMPPAACLAKVDGGELGQVIMNLIVNARDAMPCGGGIVLKLAEESLPAPRDAVGARIPPGCYVLLRLRDSGTGIAPEVLPKIFEPFFSTKGEQGTGLGLSSVLALIHRAGGYIRVESQLGQGTEFEIYLPAAEATGE